MSLFKTKFLALIIAALLLNSAIMNNAFGQSSADREAAMQIAEDRTGGKSLRAKYVERSNGQKGFRVRVIRKTRNGNERVSHVFVSLREINR